MKIISKFTASTYAMLTCYLILLFFSSCNRDELFIEQALLAGEATEIDKKKKPLPEVTAEDAPEDIMDNIATVLKAFPSAYGGAANASGGRGGVLVFVNTLNPDTPLTYDATSDTWSGGFKDACNNSTIGNNPRTIVFTVSGNIDLGGTNFDLKRSDVSILGQSAPEGGITFHNGNFRLSAVSNVILRYLRGRNGLTTQVELDGAGNFSNSHSNGIGSQNGGYNIMFDHLSVSWAGDKATGIGTNAEVPQYNHTVQRSSVSDSHTLMMLSSQNAANFDSRDNIAVYLNFFARGGNRTPEIGGTSNYLDVINNVIQSSGSKLIVIQHSKNAKANIARNYTRYMGDGTPSSNGNEFQMHGGSVTAYNPTGEYFDDLQLYTRGNYYKNNSRVVLDGTENTSKNDNLSIWSYRMGPSRIADNTPMPNNLFTVETEHNSIPHKPPTRTALEAYETIVTDGNFGACHYMTDEGTVGYYLDSWDSDMRTNLIAETMQEYFNVSNWIVPTIPNKTRDGEYDTDKDGMADSWEMRVFGSLKEGYNGDFDNDGYTNIEEFLNQVDK